MILFDTDTCIFLLKGDQEVLRKRELYEGDVAVCFITASELFYGAEKSKEKNKNLVLIEKFLSSIEVIHSDYSIVRKFGELKSSLQKKGILIPDADIFIAATAMIKTDALITGNVKHFQRFKGLYVENWISR